MFGLSAAVSEPISPMESAPSSASLDGFEVMAVVLDVYRKSMSTDIAVAPYLKSRLRQVILEGEAVIFLGFRFVRWSRPPSAQQSAGRGMLGAGKKGAEGTVEIDDHQDDRRKTLGHDAGSEAAALSMKPRAETKAAEWKAQGDLQLSTKSPMASEC